MKILSLSGKKTIKETPEEFKRRVETKVVSKLATGSVHIYAGNYTSESVKEKRRKIIKEMEF